MISMITEDDIGLDDIDEDMMISIISRMISMISLIIDDRKY